MIISGATSLVAGYLLLRLQDDYDLLGLSRQAVPSSRTMKWIKVDFDAFDPLPLAKLKASRFVHLAPLPTIGKLLPLLLSSGVERVVAVGTTSRLTKAHSLHPRDIEIVRQQKHAEQSLLEFADRENLACTILRPTMVYDGINDKNVAQVKRFIHRFGFMPVVGPASGRRQPLHADDLAHAIHLLLEKATGNRIMNLGGGEVLTYRQMVARIFTALESPQRVIQVPRTLFRIGLTLASLLPGYSYLNSAMADRMNQDMVFDNAEICSALGLQPREFTPGGWPR